MKELYIRLLCLTTILVPSILSAQQLIIDDAAVSQKHVFEKWAGTEESWIQPSIVINNSWNLSPGIILNTSTSNIKATNWLIESKFIPEKWTQNTWVAGNVSALVFDFDGKMTQVYSFIPISRNILNSNSFFHLNLGFEGNKILNDWKYTFTTGLRADLAISDRILLLSEIFSFNFKDTGFQTGFRFIIIPGQLESDLTFGRGFESGVTYPGFNLGISFTPY